LILQAFPEALARPENSKSSLRAVIHKHSTPDCLPHFIGFSSVARIRTTEGNDMQSNREERFIRLPEVVRRVGISRSSVWLWVRQGRFPRPVRVGPRVTCWRESEVDRWIAERVEAGGAR
jgi:prophage regulatory protein